MLKLADLTAGERLLLERRRNGETQAQAARRHGVSRYCYRAWEDDSVSTGQPRPALRRLQPYEICYLLRRRNGQSLADFAADAGISPWWVTQMESGRAPLQRLQEYWQEAPSAGRQVAGQGLRLLPG